MTDYIDFKALERPSSPNTYLLAPAGVCEQAEPDQSSPQYPASPDAVFSACRKVIDGQKNWSLVSADADSGKIRFVSVSPLMRYKDDIDIAVLPGPDGASSAQLAVYSRSRIGYSDMGANAKRVALLLEQLGQEGLSSETTP
ncbi:MAG: DUF1499 domain-containing protein [Hyphomonadaceae bacterium]